jgi:hypothetical protein
MVLPCNVYLGKKLFRPFSRGKKSNVAFFTQFDFAGDKTSCEKLVGKGLLDLKMNAAHAPDPVRSTGLDHGHGLTGYESSVNSGGSSAGSPYQVSI